VSEKDGGKCEKKLNTKLKAPNTLPIHKLHHFLANNQIIELFIALNYEINTFNFISKGIFFSNFPINKLQILHNLHFFHIKHQLIKSN
jgi:hypothetical protein